MLTMKATEDKRRAEDFLASCGMRQSLAESIVMLCEEGDSTLGAAALCLRGGKVYLDLLVLRSDADEINLRLGLARAILNLADLRGIRKVYGANRDLEGLYTLLRFQKEEKEFCLSLEGYFSVGHEDA